MIIYLKRLKSSTFVRVKAFPMYDGIGVSVPSPHRESTDSLIIGSYIYMSLELIYSGHSLGYWNRTRWTQNDDRFNFHPGGHPRWANLEREEGERREEGREGGREGESIQLP